MSAFHATIRNFLTVMAMQTLALTAAQASAYFSISTADEWRQNLLDGHIQATEAWDDGLELLYPGESGAFAVPRLSVLDDLEGEPALSMDFGTRTGNVIGAWEYTYDEDPDLSNAQISLSIKKRGETDRPGSFSIKLSDKNGKTMGWYWDIPVQTDATPWYQHNVKVNGGKQGAKEYKVQGGFDGTQVVKIYYDYRGLGTETPEKFETFFDHVKVSPIPEPSTLMLMGLGAAGLLARSYRKGAAGEARPARRGRQG